MVLAMVLGGLRRCEVLGLRLEDLHVGQRPVFIGEGKGGWGRSRSHKDDLLMSILNRSSTADTENDAQHQVVPPRVRRPRKDRVRFDGDVWSG